MLGIKKLNREAIIEVAMGLVLAVVLLKLLHVLFSRGFGMNFLEDADNDMENLHGRGRARRAAKKQTRRANKATRARDMQRIGTEEGSAGAQTSVYEDEGEEELEGVSSADLEQLSDAEFAEFMEMVDEAA